MNWPFVFVAMLVVGIAIVVYYSQEYRSRTRLMKLYNSIEIEDPNDKT